MLPRHRSHVLSVQIPLSFPRMAAMLVLDAPGNAISDIAGIGALPNLVALRLEHNCLASVSEVVR
jgi:hypothetical protein